MTGFLKQKCGVVLDRATGYTGQVGHFSQNLQCLEFESNMDESDHSILSFEEYACNLSQGMIDDMAESTIPMLEHWRNTVIGEGGSTDIDIDEDITKVTADIIAKTSFGTSYEKGNQVFASLRTLQHLLYKPNHFLGVPGSRWAWC